MGWTASEAASCRIGPFNLTPVANLMFVGVHGSGGADRSVRHAPETTKRLKSDDDYGYKSERSRD